ncbi:thioredoxin-like protein [Lasiosphaeris hirsuta]|uniref:Thioredoxin-like protein n=1 Tax=Lasiosphaeris hirsuta TaxID=260670 RepID=A0AA39ZVP7_9PEZI|nr:thioredoxin-like protein [Lasiosphaeris hirsuta]
MADPILITSPAQLTELAAAHKYVLIDFWATWCPPCKAIAPMYAQLSKKHSVPNGLAFAKVDVDETPDIAQEYGVTAMPSFVILVDGKPEGVAIAGVSGGGAVLGEGGKVKMLRGTDPRNLSLIASGLGELAKPKEDAEAPLKVDEDVILNVMRRDTTTATTTTTDNDGTWGAIEGG